jgi:hypothetical protein
MTKTVQTVQITYQQMVDHIESWKALGENFHAYDDDLMGITRRVVFRHMDLGTTTDGRLSLITDINLLRNGTNVLVTFRPAGNAPCR